MTQQTHRKLTVIGICIVVAICLFAYGRTLQAEELPGTQAPVQTETPVDAFAGTFFQYTDDHGVLSFAGVLEDVPEKYQDQTLELTWKALHEAADSHWTPQSTKQPAVTFWATSGQPERPAPKKCSGHLTVTSKRVQEGEYNREVWIAVDRCGKVVSVTPYPPKMVIPR